MEPLTIRNKTAPIPIIQGGMGVGVSMGHLAGAVAREGAVGIISTAQIGFYKPEFYGHEQQCNLEAIAEQIALARKISQGKGLVGVNIMVAVNQYKEHVQAAAKAGADLIISGAGLPMDLPAYTRGYDTALAPIVSSERCVRLILRKWERDYQTIPDMVVIEGPKAGGHLGFTREALASEILFDEEIVKIIHTVNKYAAKSGRKIPVIVAGGIYDHADIMHALSLGASGVQMATRFVATEECDASDAYKQAYIDASADRIRIIESPVGMPGRAIENAFLTNLKKCKEPIRHCYHCMKHCDPARIPYCITQALVNAVQGDLEHGLIFCGHNVDRVNRIVTVHDLISELVAE